MIDNNYSILLEELKKEAKRAKSNTKKQAIEVLHEIGICTKKGNIRKPYRIPK